MISKTFVMYAALLMFVPLNCAPNMYNRLATFNPAEYEPYKSEGTATISGEAYLRTKIGEIKKGAGNIIYLNPVTSYSTEWFKRDVLQGEMLAAADPRAMAYERTSVADSTGRFTFEKLPAGEYYLACPITWKVPGYFGYAQGTIEKTGGWVYAKVKVRTGEHKNVVLKPSVSKRGQTKPRRDSIG